MRWFAALLLLATTPAFAQGPVLTLATDTEARWVPFELTPRNQIRFTLELDGQPVTAILDTAVSASTIARAQADRMGLATRGESSAAAIGGRVGIRWADSRSITLGGLHRAGGELAVIEMSENATGGDAAMLVGADLVAGYALDIDYPARRFRLLQSGRMPFVGVSAPLKIGTRLSFYITDLLVDGRRVRPMVIDTGDGGTVTVSGDAWRALGRPGQLMTSTIGYGLAGPAVTDLTILPELKLGALTARAVALNIERADGYSSMIGVAGRIGSGFLQRYHVLLDPTAGHMVLGPGPDMDVPPMRSTSGLLVEHDGAALIVRHVMKGSPGEATGWRAGERICSVDGASPPTGDWPAGAPGRIVRLGLCDGPVRALTLASFY
jgi:predicted aspartyl protease